MRARRCRSLHGLLRRNHGPCGLQFRRMGLRPLRSARRLWTGPILLCCFRARFREAFFFHFFHTCRSLPFLRGEIPVHVRQALCPAADRPTQIFQICFRNVAQSKLLPDLRCRIGNHRIDQRGDDADRFRRRCRGSSPSVRLACSPIILRRGFHGACRGNIAIDGATNATMFQQRAEKSKAS